MNICVTQPELPRAVHYPNTKQWQNLSSEINNQIWNTKPVMCNQTWWPVTFSLSLIPPKNQIPNTSIAKVILLCIQSSGSEEFALCTNHLRCSSTKFMEKNNKPFAIWLLKKVIILLCRWVTRGWRVFVPKLWTNYCTVLYRQAAKWS